MADHTFTITAAAAQAAQGTVSLTVLVDAGPNTFTLVVPVEPDDTKLTFVARIRRELEHRVRVWQVLQQRGAMLETALVGLRHTVTTPDPLPFLSVNGAGVLEGRVGKETRDVLVVLEEGGVREDHHVGPNRNGRFSLHVGTKTIVSLTPVSPGGFAGAAQQVP